MSEKDPLSARIGLRLRAERHRLELSLSQLATATGNKLSKSRISNYEQGIRRLGIESAVILSKALGGVSPIYLLCLDDHRMLSDDEQRLIELYRRADRQGRRCLLSFAESPFNATEPCAEHQHLDREAVSISTPSS